LRVSASLPLDLSQTQAASLHLVYQTVPVQPDLRVDVDGTRKLGFFQLFFFSFPLFLARDEKLNRERVPDNKKTKRGTKVPSLKKNWREKFLINSMYHVQIYYFPIPTK